MRINEICILPECGGGEGHAHGGVAVGVGRDGAAEEVEGDLHLVARERDVRSSAWKGCERECFEEVDRVRMVRCMFVPYCARKRWKEQ
jgi:hypothetical protein